MKHKKDCRIREAFALYREDWEAALPTDEQIEETVCISDELEARMTEAINGQKKKRPAGRLVLRVAACAAAIVLVVATVFVAGVKRGSWWGIVEKHPDTPMVEHDLLDDWEGSYQEHLLRFEGEALLPSYIPSGFVLDTVDGGKTYIRYSYKNSSDQYLYIQQSISGTTLPLELKDEFSERVMIRDGLQGIYYLGESKPYLFFDYEGYTFDICGDFESDELVKIARSMIK